MYLTELFRENLLNMFMDGETLKHLKAMWFYHDHIFVDDEKAKKQHIIVFFSCLKFQKHM